MARGRGASALSCGVRTATRDRLPVTDVEIHHQTSLAREATQVLSQTAPGRLVLITCGDPDDVRCSCDVVVYAEPVATG